MWPSQQISTSPLKNKGSVSTQMWKIREKNPWDYLACGMALVLGPHVTWFLCCSLDLVVWLGFRGGGQKRLFLIPFLKLSRGGELAEWRHILEMKDLDVENREELILGTWEWSQRGAWTLKSWAKCWQLGLKRRDRDGGLRMRYYYWRWCGRRLGMVCFRTDLSFPT